MQMMKKNNDFNQSVSPDESSGLIVYRATNVVNGKVYVGVTKGHLNDRIKDHCQKAATSKGHGFQDAIATYGPEAFKWEQIDTAGNTNELAEKEKDYIIKYDSKENGYNSDSGGGIKKTVYQYDLKSGKLLNTFDSLSDAAKSIRGITKKQISKACLGTTNKCGGYYWSYRYQEPFKPGVDERKREVCKLDSKDNIIAAYGSISEASSETGINKSSIAKVCRGERNYAGGYKWKFI